MNEMGNHVLRHFSANPRRAQTPLIPPPAGPGAQYVLINHPATEPPRAVFFFFSLQKKVPRRLEQNSSGCLPDQRCWQEARLQRLDGLKETLRELSEVRQRREFKTQNILFFSPLFLK